MRKLIIASLAAAALPGIAHAAAFTNGGFESGAPVNDLVNVGTGSSAITGWTVTSGDVDYIGTYWEAGEGSRSLDLSGSAPATIAQTFDTIANGVYLVNFLMAGNPVGGPTVKSLTASAGAFSESYTFDTTAATTSAMNWTTKAFSFIAAGTSTTLSFASNTAGYYGPALDGVSVTYLAPVPEPGTWAMLVAGLGTVGGMLRRRTAPGRAIA